MNGDGDVDDNLSDEMSALPDKTSSTHHIDDVQQQLQPVDSPHNDLRANNAGSLITSSLLAWS